MIRAAAIVASIGLAASTAHASAGDLWPPTKKYEPGKPIPDGYHYEERSRDGLAVGGFLMFVPGALMFTAGAASPEGGFIDMRPAMMIFGGALALGGTAMFVVGVTTSRKLLVRNNHTITLAPALDRTGSGLTLLGRF